MHVMTKVPILLPCKSLPCQTDSQSLPMSLLMLLILNVESADVYTGVWSQVSTEILSWILLTSHTMSHRDHYIIALLTDSHFYGTPFSLGLGHKSMGAWLKTNLRDRQKECYIHHHLSSFILDIVLKPYSVPRHSLPLQWSLSKQAPRSFMETDPRIEAPRTFRHI